MWAKVGDISTIRAATVFREPPLRVQTSGNVRALTIKDLVSTWPIDFRILLPLEVGEELLNNCALPGEVLIPSRGDYYPARYFRGPDTNIFPLGQINLIRPSNEVLGPYLSWYLNQPAAQREIQSLLTGTSIRALTKQNLQQIRVRLPSLEVQAQIAHLQEMREETKILRTRMIELEEIELEEVCRSLLRNSEAA